MIIIVFLKKNLWPKKKLNLKCAKLKYFNYNIAGNFKIFIQSHKCDIYKIFKNYNIIFIKN